MGSEITPVEPAKEPAKKLAKSLKENQVTSIDENAGTVVVSTNRPDGEVIRATINGKRREATIKDGQAWLQFGGPLGNEFTIGL